MAEEGPREQGGEQKRSELGYDALAMNEVPPATTAEPTGSGRGARGLILLVVGVLVAAAVVMLGVRLLSGAHPGKEAEDRLRKALQESPETAVFWQKSFIMTARYVSGDRLRIEFAPTIRTARFMEEGKPEKERVVVGDARDRQVMREATRQVMKVLRDERPGRDLYIDGYIGDDKVVQAEYRHRETLTATTGKEVLDIVVEVAGDPKEGVQESAGTVGGVRSEDPFQAAIVVDVREVEPDRFWMELSPGIRTEEDRQTKVKFVPSAEDRETVRRAIGHVMATLSRDRQGRNLLAEGYHEEDKIVEAEYRAEGGGTIIVRVAGDQRAPGSEGAPAPAQGPDSGP